MVTEDRMQRACNLLSGFQEKLLQRTKFHASRFQQTHHLHEVLQKTRLPYQWTLVNLLPYPLDFWSCLKGRQQIQLIWNLPHAKYPCSVTLLSCVHFLRWQKHLFHVSLEFDMPRGQHLQMQRGQEPSDINPYMDLPSP